VGEKRSVTRAPPLPQSLNAHAPWFAELSLGAKLIFLLHKKTERLTESLTNASQLVGLGRAMWAWPTLLGFFLKLLIVGKAHTVSPFHSKRIFTAFTDNGVIKPL
jgi:hypothetical protein